MSLYIFENIWKHHHPHHPFSFIRLRFFTSLFHWKSNKMKIFYFFGTEHSFRMSIKNRQIKTAGARKKHSIILDDTRFAEKQIANKRIEWIEKIITHTQEFLDKFFFFLFLLMSAEKLLFSVISFHFFWCPSYVLYSIYSINKIICWICNKFFFLATHWTSLTTIIMSLYDWSRIFFSVLFHSFTHTHSFNIQFTIVPRLFVFLLLLSHNNNNNLSV